MISSEEKGAKNPHQQWFQAVFVQAIQEDDTEITFIDSDINDTSIYNNGFNNKSINNTNENKNKNSSLFEMINNTFVTEISQKPTEIYDNDSQRQKMTEEFTGSQGIALTDLFGVENLKHFDGVQCENDKKWVSQNISRVRLVLSCLLEMQQQGKCLMDRSEFSNSYASLMWQCASTLSRVQGIVARANMNSSKYYTIAHIDQNSRHQSSNESTQVKGRIQPVFQFLDVSSDDLLEENKHEDITYLPAEESQEMELFSDDSQFSYPVYPINFY